MPTDTNVADRDPNPREHDPISPDARSNPATAAASVGAPTEPGDAASEHRTEAEAAEAGVDGDAADTIHRMSIWDTIRSYTAPIVLSEKWNFLIKPGGRLRIEMPPSEFVASLEQDYTIDELIEIGLYQRGGDDVRQTIWSEGDAPLYVSIDENDSAITWSRSCGSLFPMTRTALDYALEHIPPDCTQEPVTLFVVDSLDAVDIMCRLGLRAVTRDGLDAIGSDDILRLFAGDERSDCNWRFRLLLVNFDIPHLTNCPSAALETVIQRLADAAEVYGIHPPRRFGVCRPSAQEFQVLERAISFGDSAQISKIFEKWAAAAQREIITNWRTHFAAKPANYFAARTTLIRALKLSNDLARFEVPAALAAYRIAGEGAVIQKFYAEFDRSSEAFDQFDLLAAAGFAETFFDSDPLVQMAEAVLAGGTPASAAELRAESFEQQQRCVREIKRIQRDRKPKRWVGSPARATAIPQPAEARLAW